MMEQVRPAAKPLQPSVSALSKSYLVLAAAMNLLRRSAVTHRQRQISGRCENLNECFIVAVRLALQPMRGASAIVISWELHHTTDELFIKVRFRTSSTIPGGMSAASLSIPNHSPAVTLSTKRPTHVRR